MVLILILAACFLLLYIVEVHLGGALPHPCAPEGPMISDAFFGQALPLAAAGIGLPMSFQHHWAILLVIGAAVLYIHRKRRARRS
ncbi:hypothetical protein [Fundidesulfovibrio agrisoli]|uniref:hypothetical protein n=1 Tax=Fundidesulfovibrio agrisoli TaxID=2922717 RepID=UPI001FAE618E|nr:hypothetical protein [Fundidesulfovibrio agrisoli]